MKKVIIGLAIFICIAIATYLIVEFKVKKWKCTEGKCERVIGGDFSSLDKCKNMCKIKKEKLTKTDKPKKKVRWADQK